MRPARLLLLVVVSLALAAPWACSSGEKAPRVDKDTVKGWLDNPEVVIVDVRATGDWEGSDRKIKGAVRQDPNAVETWAASVPKDKKIVLYCAWAGEATSARVAQQLLDMGFNQVWALEGGWLEWDKAGYPTEPKQ